MKRPIDRELVYQLLEAVEYLWLENQGLKAVCIESKVTWEERLADYVSDCGLQAIARQQFARLREQIDASEDYETLLRVWLSTLPVVGKPS